MSGKKAKKLRKELRAQLQHAQIDADYFDRRVEERVDAAFEEVVRKTASKIRAEYEKRLRPKPRFCPAWLWKRMQRLVLLPEPEAPSTPADAGLVFTRPN